MFFWTCVEEFPQEVEKGLLHACSLLFPEFLKTETKYSLNVRNQLQWLLKVSLKEVFFW